MKTLYFDCFSGISGDMVVGALLDLELDMKYLEKELKKLNLKDFKIQAKKVVKNGISATKFSVVTKTHAHERNLKEINRIIDSSSLNDKTKKKIKEIFLKIAKAESKVHNQPIDKIHFHEVGAIDTIVDVAAAVIGIQKLSIKKVYCSPVNVGSGFVKFSHGRFPVPAPATSELLKNMPVYHNNLKFELATPTGAAIISSLAESFGEMPTIELKKIGYGAGEKDLKEQPNVLRAFLGETEMESKNSDKIKIIETNIDDMNPEIFPYVIERLMENGALDAYLASIMMKKGRPAVKLTVLCDDKNVGKMAEILFDETTTIGVRIFPASRIKLEREIKIINTKYGKVRFKISSLDGKVKNISPEFKDCARIAREKKVPLKKVYKEVKQHLSNEFHRPPFRNVP